MVISAGKKAVQVIENPRLLMGITVTARIFGRRLQHWILLYETDRYTIIALNCFDRFLYTKSISSQALPIICTDTFFFVALLFLAVSYR